MSSLWPIGSIITTPLFVIISKSGCWINWNWYEWTPRNAEQYIREYTLVTNTDQTVLSHLKIWNKQHKMESVSRVVSVDYKEKWTLMIISGETFTELANKVAASNANLKIDCSANGDRNSDWKVHGDCNQLLLQ